MNKRNILTVIFTFIAIFLTDYLIHGVLLMDLYEQTSELWRGEEDMICWWMLLMQFALSVLLVVIFGQNFEDKGFMEGMRFGTFAGLVLGTAMAGTYAYMPIPFSLALSWFIGALIQFTIVGIILQFSYAKFTK